MRVEVVNGRNLLCGYIVPRDKVQPGQTWAAASGSDHTVTVENVDREWVDYSWIEADGAKKTHTKLIGAFQCRYCLALDTPELPKWAKSDT